MASELSFTPAELHAVLRHDFDAASVQRAAAYANDECMGGAIVSVVPEGLRIDTTVMGSDPEPYGTVVTLSRRDRHGLECVSECSCPVGDSCKHSAAILLRLIEDPAWVNRVAVIPRSSELNPEFELSDDVDTTAGAAEKVTKTQPSLVHSWKTPRGSSASSRNFPRALLDWVERVAVANLPVPVMPERTVSNVSYLLSLNAGTARLEPAFLRPVKRGGFETAQILSWEHLRMHSEAIGALELDRLLASDSSSVKAPYSYGNFVLDPTKGGPFLEKIIATGRCYWRATKKKSEPLKLGADRTGEIGWAINEKRAHRARLNVEPAATAVLPLNPPWYVDLDRNECGRVLTSVPGAVASAWLTAPPVSSEFAEELSLRLSREVPLPVPLPKQLIVTEIRDRTPIFCLKLMSREFEPFDVLPWTPKKLISKFKVSLAVLEFDYGDHRIHWLHDEDPLEKQVNHEVVRVYRQQQLERNAVTELADLGAAHAYDAFPFLNMGVLDQELSFPTPESWARFVTVEVPRLKAMGWKIEEEADFDWRPATVDDWISAAGPFRKSGESDSGPANEWFEAELGVIVEGERHNLLPMLLDLFERDPAALSQERLDDPSPNASMVLRLPDGRFFQFPMTRARPMLGVLLDLFDGRTLNPRGNLSLSRFRTLELIHAEGWRWLGPRELQEMAQRLKEFRGIKPVPPPKGLRASLRPYQQEGVNWLQFIREYDLAGLLADDMGLGKTVQTLAHLLIEKESGRAKGPSLVVAPTSLMTNWRQEAERFAPDLKVLVLHGLDRRDQFHRIAEHDLVLTTYPLLPRDLPQLLEQSFHLVILDEAQFIKNSKTTYAQAACQLQARHRLCLTGTPMENHLGELWSLFRFLLPGFLGDEVDFNGSFRRPIEKHGDQSRRAVLARRVGPFMIRRRKDQVASELPEKTEITQSVELTGAQRDLYESVRLTMHSKVREAVASKGLARSHIVVLDALLKLRQICCHPQLLRIPSAAKVRDSAKLDLLMELLGTLIAEGRRVLLFSQFTSMLALIETELKKQKIPYVLLTGDTTDRATPVVQFQKGEVPLFLISLKAGGTGLNLTAADTVIHFDPWWNPAVENQATDRAHRIGQTKKVFVYRLIAVGTVEEKIAALQVRKRELVEGLLNERGTGKLELTPQDIDFLFDPLA